jgi:hypothetical protein
MERKQLSFSTTWDGFPSDADAKAARDAEWRELRKEGWQARRWVLKDQLRQYAGLGIPDGRVCDVYKIDAWR